MNVLPTVLRVASFYSRAPRIEEGACSGDCLLEMSGASYGKFGFVGFQNLLNQRPVSFTNLGLFATAFIVFLSLNEIPLVLGNFLIKFTIRSVICSNSSCLLASSILSLWILALTSFFCERRVNDSFLSSCANLVALASVALASVSAVLACIQ